MQLKTQVHARVLLVNVKFLRGCVGQRLQHILLLLLLLLLLSSSSSSLLLFWKGMRIYPTNRYLHQTYGIYMYLEPARLQQAKVLSKGPCVSNHGKLLFNRRETLHALTRECAGARADTLIDGTPWLSIPEIRMACGRTACMLMQQTHLANTYCNRQSHLGAKSTACNYWTNILKQKKNTHISQIRSFETVWEAVLQIKCHVSRQKLALAKERFEDWSPLGWLLANFPARNSTASPFWTEFAPTGEGLRMIWLPSPWFVKVREPDITIRPYQHCDWLGTWKKTGQRGPESWDISTGKINWPWSIKKKTVKHVKKIRRNLPRKSYLRVGRLPAVRSSVPRLQWAVAGLAVIGARKTTQSFLPPQDPPPSTQSNDHSPYQNRHTHWNP